MDAPQKQPTVVESFSITLVLVRYVVFATFWRQIDPYPKIRSFFSSPTVTRSRTENRNGRNVSHRANPNPQSHTTSLLLTCMWSWITAQTLAIAPVGSWPQAASPISVWSTRPKILGGHTCCHRRFKLVVVLRRSCGIFIFKYSRCWICNTGSDYRFVHTCLIWIFWIFWCENCYYEEPI